MTVSKNSRVVASKSVVICELDKGLALLDLDRNRYFGLNPTGTLVWNTIEQPTSVEDICAAVAQRFKIEPSACQGDVLALLSQLVDSGLARAVDAPAD